MQSKKIIGFNQTSQLKSYFKNLSEVLETFHKLENGHNSPENEKLKYLRQMNKIHQYMKVFECYEQHTPQFSKYFNPQEYMTIALNAQEKSEKNSKKKYYNLMNNLKVFKSLVEFNNKGKKESNLSLDKENSQSNEKVILPTLFRRSKVLPVTNIHFQDLINEINNSDSDKEVKNRRKSRIGKSINYEIEIVSRCALKRRSLLNQKTNFYREKKNFSNMNYF